MDAVGQPGRLTPELGAARERQGPAPGLLALAIGAPVLFAAICFFLMFIVWRRMDRQNWRGSLPEAAPKHVLVAVQRSIKIPVVIMEPDRSYDVAYVMKTGAAGHDAGSDHQLFGVVAMLDTCGPLWRAQSMTVSDGQCTPRIPTLCGGAPSCSPAHSPGAGISQAGHGAPPIGFAVSPVETEGSSPLHSWAGWAAAMPKRAGRTRSFDGSLQALKLEQQQQQHHQLGVQAPQEPAPGQLQGQQEGSSAVGEAQQAPLPPQC